MHQSPLSRLISAFLLLLLIHPQAIGQQVRQYQIMRTAMNTPLDVQIDADDYPDLLKGANNGSISKFKLNFEEQYRIRYTPDKHFIGLDTIIVKALKNEYNTLKPHFEGYIFQVTGILSQDDYYRCTLSDQNLELDPLANDISSEGTLKIKNILIAQNVDVEIASDGKSLVFNPINPGLGLIRYLVCSEDGAHCSDGTIRVWIDDPLAPSYPDSLFYQIYKNQSLTLILPSGFQPPASHYYTGSITQSGNQLFNYIPKERFTGTEIIRFQKQINGGFQFQYVVIDVLDPFATNGWIMDDVLYTETDNEALISIFDNDLLSGEIELITGGLEGTIEWLGSGLLKFIPAQDFSGYTYFRYAICHEGRCDTAMVNVIVHDFRPKEPTTYLQTVKNHPITFTPTLPIDDFYYKILDAPDHGSLQSDHFQKITYAPNQEYVGTDVIKLAYCTINDGNHNCTEFEASFEIRDGDITTSCEDNCVWPGDINYDGRVNATDILPLGVNIGAYGKSRIDQDPSLWYGRESENWSRLIGVGVSDLKHADSDGDGMVSVADSSSIYSFYSNQHIISYEPIPLSDPTPLDLEMLQPFVEAGDWAYVEFSLGTVQIPASQILGLSFSLVIENGRVDNNSFSVELNESWFTHESAILSLAQSPGLGKLDVGLVRTNRQWVTGHGVLGHIRFIVEEDLNGFRYDGRDLKVTIKATDIKLLDKDGNYLPVPEIQKSFVLTLPEKLRSEEMAVYPNPVSDLLEISVPKNLDIQQISIIDRLGQIVNQFQPEHLNRTFADVSALPDGLYSVRASLSSGKTLIRKFLKISD